MPCCVDKLSQNWQLACQRYSALTPSHHKLFWLLGVDGAALWVAAVVRGKCHAHTYGAYLAPYMDHENFVLNLPGQTLAQLSEQRLKIESQLHLLLPVMMMHQVAALPAQSDIFAELAMLSAQVGRASVGAWQKLLPGALAAEGQIALETFTGSHPPAEELGALLPLLCTLLSGLQLHLPARGAAAAASSGGSCSCCSGVGGSSFAQREMPMVTYVLCQLVQPSVWVELVLGDVRGTDALMTAMSEQMKQGKKLSEMQVPQRGLCTVTGFPDNAKRVLVALESYLRHLVVSAGSGQQQQPGAKSTMFALLKCLEVENQAGYEQQAMTMGPLVVLARAAGPGSTEQQQLYSCLSSLLKLSAAAAGSAAWAHGRALSTVYAMTAADAALQLLLDSGAAAAAAKAAAAAAGSSSSSSLESGVTYLGLEVPETNPPAAAAAAGYDPLVQLPSLAVFGRCCLIWAQQLQQEGPLLLQAQQAQQARGVTLSQAAKAINSPPLGAGGFCMTACICLEVGSNGKGQLEAWAAAWTGFSRHM